MKSNVLFANTTSLHGGAEEALLSYMQIAAKGGMKPRLLVPAPGWLTQRCSESGIPFHCLPTLPGPFAANAVRQFLPWIPNACAIAALVRRERIDLIHVNTPRTAYHAGLAARITATPCISHVHDIVNLPFATPAKARLLGLLCKKFVCVSGAVSRAIVAQAPTLAERTCVIYNGIARDLGNSIPPVDLRAMFELPRDTIIIGNVSTMTPWKGQGLLVRAFCRARRSFPNIRLVLVGAPLGGDVQRRCHAELVKQCADPELEGAVVLAGWRDDSLAFIKAFDIFAHVPTQPDPLPTVLLHAAALHRPIVASNIGGIPEIVGNNCGLLVSPGNEDELANALLRMLGDESLRRTAAAAAAARAADIFPLEKLRADLLHLYAGIFQNTLDDT